MIQTDLLKLGLSLLDAEDLVAAFPGPVLDRAIQACRRKGKIHPNYITAICRRLSSDGDSDSNPRPPMPTEGCDRCRNGLITLFDLDGYEWIAGCQCPAGVWRQSYDGVRCINGPTFRSPDGHQRTIRI